MSEQAASIPSQKNSLPSASCPGPVPEGMGMEGGDCRLSGTAAPPYLPRHGCRQFIHASMTLNRNGKNVHAGIDWEGFLNSRRAAVADTRRLPVRQGRAGRPGGRGGCARPSGAGRSAHGEGGLYGAGAAAAGAAKKTWPERKGRQGSAAPRQAMTPEGAVIRPRKGKTKKGPRGWPSPKGISPRHGRCCGVCGGAFLLPLPRAGRAWRAVRGCGRAPPGAWPPGAAA